MLPQHIRMLYRKLCNHKYSNKRVDIIITNENKITCDAAGLYDDTTSSLKAVNVAIFLAAQDILPFGILHPTLFSNNVKLWD